MRKKPFVITVACQKGGVGKTTCSIILSTLLAMKGYKVLGIDSDQQGNYTETLTGIPIRDIRLAGFLGLLDALDPKEDPREYLWDDKDDDAVLKLPENLDLLIGDENAGVFGERLAEYGIKDRNKAMEAMIAKFGDDYDFIVIDTAPALSTMLTNALIASDGVICMFQPEKYCYSAMFSLFETIGNVQKKANPKLRPLGILTTLIDSRRFDMREFMERIHSDEKLGKYCFDSIIKRTAVTGRLAYAGVVPETNPEALLGMAQYEPFVDEMLDRIDNPDSLTIREFDTRILDEYINELEERRRIRYLGDLDISGLSPEAVENLIKEQEALERRRNLEGIDLSEIDPKLVDKYIKGDDNE